MHKKIISSLILAVSIAILGWQVAQRNEEVIFPYVFLFAVAAAILGWLTQKHGNAKISSNRWLTTSVFLFLSAAATAFIITGWDFVLFDDAGFLLRYLDNFAKGYFYSFNPQDGPVFGISSFSYGLIAGTLSMTHLVTPDQSIVVTSIAGLFVICFLLLKILQRYGMNPMQLFLSFLFILFCGKFFLNSMTTGMETPVHLAIVLSAIYFFIAEKSSLMWLMLTLSVISKLDAVPLAVTLGSIHLLRNRKSLLPISLKNRLLKDFALFCLLPLGAWIIFAFIVFGSPLPQSAFSKIYFHLHPEEYWFPFLSYFIEDHFRAPVFYVFLVLFVVHSILATLYPARFSVRGLAFGLGFFSTMILYYFYNPQERMTWYYAMPDMFLLAQIAVSFYFIYEEYVLNAYRPYIYPLIFAGAGLFLFSDTYYGRAWMKNYLDYTENERITIGKYLATITGEQDTLVAQHGHVSRYTKAYVIDMTGLNSKLATEHKNSVGTVTKKYKPDFVITHGLKEFLAMMDSNDYVPVKSFYDICENGWPAWRIFKRNPSGENHIRMVVPDDSLIKCYDRKWDFGIPVTIDKNVQITLPYDSSMRAVSFGVKRKAKFFYLQVALFSDNRLIQKQTFPVELQGHNGKATSRYSKEIVFRLNNESRNTSLKRRLEITGTSGEEIIVIEPLFEIDSDTHNSEFVPPPASDRK